MFSSRLQNEQTDNLARAFLALSSMEDCYRLFEDLFTIREIQDLSQRLEVAQLLQSQLALDENNMELMSGLMHVLREHSRKAEYK